MTNRVLLIFLCLLHAVFFIMALHFGSYKIPDSYDYLYQADNFRNYGSWYAWNWNDTIKPDYFTKRTPGYAFFIFLLGSKQWLLLFVQNILSIGTLWVIFRMLSDLTQKPKKVALLIAVILLLQSNQLIYANTIISEIPFQFILCLASYCLFRYLRKPEYRLLAVSVFLFAIALLIKPVMLFFVLPLSLLLLILFFRDKNWKVLPLIIVLPLVIMLWSNRNEKLMGYNHYTSITTVNLKDYNTRLTMEAKYGAEKADSIISGLNSQAEVLTDYSSRMQFIGDTCKTLLANNIGTYAVVHGKGMIAMLLDPGRFDYVSFFALGEEGGENGLMYRLARGDFSGMVDIIKKQSALVTFFFILNFIGSIFLLIAALFSLKFIKTETALLVVIFGLLAYFWVLTGPVGTARYKSAILPFLMLLGIWGLIGKGQVKNFFPKGEN